MYRPLLVLGCLVLGGTAAATAHAEPAQTRVFLNGTLTPVRFSDGDTFRPVSGPHREKNARLMGFNAMESYGPVHRFGQWHPRELFHFAKLAHKHATKGTWHCETDGQTDTYGRALWLCEDLAVSLLEQGLVHTISVDLQPARPRFRAAQARAVAARRGLWSRGAPTYILTSAHDPREGENAYLRLVSVADGHSALLPARQYAEECDEICVDVSPLPEVPFVESASAPGASLRWTPEEVRTMQLDFLALGAWPIGVSEAEAKQLALAITADRRPPDPALRTCLVFVNYKRRYGASRARCLRPE